MLRGPLFSSCVTSPFLSPFGRRHYEGAPASPTSSSFGQRDTGMSCSKAAVVNLSSLAGSMTATPESYSRFPVMSYRVSKAKTRDQLVSS